MLWNIGINPHKLPAKHNCYENKIKIKIKILLSLCASRGNEQKKKLIYALNSRIIKIKKPSIYHHTYTHTKQS